MQRSLSRYTPRRPQRHAVRLDCQVVRERDFKLVAYRTLDVSEFGMLVLPTMPVLTGERLIVSFMAPFSRYWVDAEACVARVIHGRRPSDPGRALGISFETVDQVSRALLRRNLADLPMVPPTWRLKHLARALQPARA